jgi:hypothetical protein
MKNFYLIIVGLATTVSLTFAFSSGPLDGYCGNPPNHYNCTQCHSDFPVNSGIGTLQLTGPLTYNPGDTLTYVIALANPGQTRWGFELTSMTGNQQAGTINVLDPIHTQLSDNPSPQPDFLKHTTAGTYAGIPNGTAWAFDWVAPATGIGPVTFYLAGNAANNSGDTHGDYIYTTTLVVEQASAVSPQISIPLDSQLLSNYPNPFNPTTTLTFSLNQPAPISLNLYDIMGREVMSLYQGNMSAGFHQFSIDGSSLASGIYFARMVTPQSNSIRAINLVK